MASFFFCARHAPAKIWHCQGVEQTRPAHPEKSALNGNKLGRTGVHDYASLLIPLKPLNKETP
jgi:hypothetical protein